MKSSLKIMWKRKIKFLLSETLLFFLEQNIFYSWRLIFLRFLGMNYLSSFFFAETDNKKHASEKTLNATQVKLIDWVIKNDHVINCVMFFWKWFKHGQTSNVIWLFTTWLLIFWLKVANKKPLFITKPASIWIEISC